MCEVLDISISNYYKYKDSYDNDHHDYLVIKRIFEASRKTYGYRRITDELNDNGYKMNHKKVLRIMSKYGLQPEYIRQIKPYYGNQYNKENIRGNLLNRNFNQKGWVTDITYLTINGKRAYLSTIIDLETRNVVAYNISFSISLLILFCNLICAFSTASRQTKLYLCALDSIFVPSIYSFVVSICSFLIKNWLIS